jgi:transposase InsO family protein
MEAFSHRERRHSSLGMLSPAEYERTQINLIEKKTT